MDLNQTEVWVHPLRKDVSIYGPNSTVILENLGEKGVMLMVADGGYYKILPPRI